MDIAEYIANVCDMFKIDPKVVNKKLSLKETLERSHAYITDGLLNDEFDHTKVYSERDMNVAQLEVIRVVMSICNKRGRY